MSKEFPSAVPGIPPESKPWSRLHEFVATDLDVNIFRVFYNLLVGDEVAHGDPSHQGLWPRAL